MSSQVRAQGNSSPLLAWTRACTHAHRRAHRVSTWKALKYLGLTGARNSRGHSAERTLPQAHLWRQVTAGP